MRKYKFIDSWSFDTGYGTGNKNRLIGVFESDTVEDAIIQAEKNDEDKQVISSNNIIKISNNKWTMLGYGCPHWITITEL